MDGLESVDVTGEEFQLGGETVAEGERRFAFWGGGHSGAFCS